MTNRLELNWSLDGIVDEQRYYCSETPIDSENLPVPKAILDGEARSYIDTDVEVGKTYYVRVGSVKNVIEKISDEVTYIPKKSKIIINNGVIIDVGSAGLSWTNNSALLIEPADLTFQSNSYIISNAYVGFASDFKLTFSFKRSSSASTYPALISLCADSVWNTSARRFNLCVGGNGSAPAGVLNKVYLALSRTNSIEIINPVLISNDVWYDCEFSRIAGVINIKVNEISASKALADVFDTAQIGIGRSNVDSQQFFGTIKNVIIH
jgi:hypothetical protein